MRQAIIVCPTRRALTCSRGQRLVLRAAVGLEQHVEGQFSLAMGECFAGTIAQQDREMLLHFLGHDLRSPLSTIVLGGRAIARRESLSSASTRDLERVLSAAQRMEGIIADLTDYLLPHVFEPFKRGKKGEGAGLGLYIVHRIAQAHDGSVDGESSAARGTTFRVRLPRQGVGPTR